MASEVYGFEALNQSSVDGSIVITVPTDADLILVCGSGYSINGDERLYSALNFDNTTSQHFTKVLSQRYNATFTGATLEAFFMASTDTNWPGTGAQTLYFDGVGFGEGFNNYVFYARGVGNLSAPIIDSDSADNSSAYTGSLTGVGVNDISVVIAYEYAQAPDVNPAGTGQTAQIESAAFNNAGFSLGYELGESAMRVDASGTSEMTALSFAINSVAAAGSIEPLRRRISEG